MLVIVSIYILLCIGYESEVGLYMSDRFVVQFSQIILDFEIVEILSN